PHFSRLDSSEKQRFLAEVLNLCDSHQLSFVMNYVSPRLKKDPFKVLPHELCLRVSAFINSRDNATEDIFGRLIECVVDSVICGRSKDAGESLTGFAG